MKRRWISLLALLLARASPLLGGEKPVAFRPELAPLVGTWKHMHQVTDKKKKIPLYLVIKEEKGLLRLRYQVAVRDKVYTSEWDARLDVQLQVNIKEEHRPSIQAVTEPAAGIEVTDRIHYSGTFKTPDATLEGVYQLDEGGKLLYRCRSLRRDQESLPCTAPVEYERVSTDTRWPD